MGEALSFAKYKDNSRWPHTYAIDMIREIPDKLEHPRLGPIVVKLSRSEASGILKLFAEATGLSYDSLAVDLAMEYVRRYDP
jgi:hypothetical protein